MPLSDRVREQISSTIAQHSVVLFMKGNKNFPQCGFSAMVVGVLKQHGVPFETVNVLADPELREGIKEFSSWPTIPQLYVRGDFVGGADIVRELDASGELGKLLGVSIAGTSEPASAPSIEVTPAAARAFADATEGGDVLHLTIDGAFQHDLYFGPATPGAIVARSGETVLHLDAASARRANGLRIDFVSGGRETGFKIDNPNAPPRVQSLSVEETKARLDAGSIELFDVRPEAERAIAKITAAHSLAGDGLERLRGLPKDTPIALHCHHGMRSRRAGEQLVADGFTRVYNVEGGIDAWSERVDPSVPRY